MIFVLDATNKRLRFTASAGTDIHFTSHWADATASGLTEGQTQGVNTTGPDDVVPAPAASTRRVVKLITFHNTSTTLSRTVTLVNDVGGTSRTIAVFTLAPLATWYSDTAATTAIADGDKGDITVSGSGATWTIDNDAITTAKILDANVTLAKIANITSGNLLGRTSGGSGPVQEITPGTGVLAWLQTPTSANLAAAVSDETGSGTLVFSTSPTFTGQVSFAVGTVTAPSITWSGDLNTGCYSPAADTVAVTTGGVERMRVTASGNVGINTTNPSSLLHLGGTTNKTIRLDTALGNTGWYAAWQDGCITSVNRDPLSGSFVDSNKTAAFIILQGQSNDGYISFSTSNLNGVFPPERMRIDSGGRVGIGTSTPATSAQLEIASTTGALLLPRLTTTERDALTAVNGMIIYNTTVNQMQGRINGAWTAM